MSVAGDVAYNIPNTFSRSFLRDPHKFRKFKIYLLLKMLFLTNEPAKKAEINILTARDTTGPGY